MKTEETDELVRARVEEAIAQRRHDGRTSFAASLWAVMGLTLPLMITLVFWSNTANEKAGDDIKRDIVALQTQETNAIEKCLLTRADPKATVAVENFYCETQAQVSRAQLDALRSIELRDTHRSTIIFVGVLGFLAIAFGAWTTHELASSSDALEKAQTTRIQLEAHVTTGLATRTRGPIAGRRGSRRA